MSDRGFAPLLIIVVIAIILGAIYLISQGKIKNPLTPKKEAQVELQTQYQNPFDKNAQYVNPFASYKNPFDNLK